MQLAEIENNITGNEDNSFALPTLCDGRVMLDSNFSAGIFSFQLNTASSCVYASHTQKSGSYVFANRKVRLSFLFSEQSCISIYMFLLQLQKFFDGLFEREIFSSIHYIYKGMKSESGSFYFYYVNRHDFHPLGNSNLLQESSNITQNHSHSTYNHSYSTQQMLCLYKGMAYIHKKMTYIHKKTVLKYRNK